jgi:GT2 family glycosyltransferase
MMSSTQDDEAQARLAIVIPTRCRSEILERGLDSIISQPDLPEGFQVIVVDNAPEPDQAVQELCHASKYARLSLIYIYSSTPGASLARNLGVSLAKAAFIGFIDDDAYLSENWYATAIAIQDMLGPDIYGGQYQPYYTTHKPVWFKDQYASGSHGTNPGWLEDRQYLSGANLVVKRSLFISLGGFSTQFGGGTATMFGEETDLQHRAVKQGVKIWYSPELLVYHHVYPAKMHLGVFIRNSWEHGKAKGMIYRDDLSGLEGSSRIRLIISRLWKIVQKGFELAGLSLQIILRNREKYPYYQNFVIERMCPKISNLGLLVNLLKSDL